MINKSLKRIFILLYVLLFYTTLSAQNTERLELIGADTLRMDKINGQEVRRLTSEVKFKQGDARMFCNTAIEYVDEKRVVLIGDVRILNEGKWLYANFVNYFGDSKTALAYDNVKMIDSTKTLSADSVRYLIDEEIAFARSNVRIIDEKENIILSGNRAEYHRETAYAKITQDPVFIKTDTTEDSQLRISGIVMEMFNDGDSVKVESNVRIIRGEITAVCEMLLYNKKENKVYLYENPAAQRKNDYLTGVRMELVLKENKVEEIIIHEKAVVVSKNDTLQTEPLYDLMSGEEMFISVQDERIDTVVVKGRATSYYHILEEGEEQGLNKILSDEIILLFKDNALAKVWGKSSPGSTNGVFYPLEYKSVLENELTEILNKSGILEKANLQVTATDESSKKSLNPF